MRVLFFGTPPVAAKILASLFKTEHEIVAVISRPDKPKGRSKKLAPTPVKEYLQEHHPEVPLYQPEKVSSEESISLIKSYAPDLFIVVAYGAILRQNLLDVPKLFPINIHYSLLPKYRGAAPMQRSIMGGEKETGITFMVMDAGMDTGDILKVEKVPLDSNQTFGELEKNLEELSVKTLPAFLCDLEKGKLTRTAQDHTQATHAGKITKEDCKVDFQNSAQIVHNQIRALSPAPCAYTLVEIADTPMRMKILRAKCVEGEGSPGQILHYESGKWVVACASGAIEILELQLEGKKPMRVSDFMRGQQILTKPLR